MVIAVSGAVAILLLLLGDCCCCRWSCYDCCCSCWAGAVVANDAVSVMTGANTVGDAVIITVAIAVAVAGLV